MRLHKSSPWPVHSSKFVLIKEVPQGEPDTSDDSKPTEGFGSFRVVRDEEETVLRTPEEPQLEHPNYYEAFFADLPSGPADHKKNKAPEAGTVLQAGEADREKQTGKLSGLFRKSNKLKEKEPAKDAKAAASSVGKQQDKVPEILISEGPSATKDKAPEQSKQITEPHEGDKSGTSRQTIVEIPSGPHVHRLSEDKRFISKAPRGPHRLSMDEVATLGTPPVAHVAHPLEQDQDLQAKPAHARRVSAGAISDPVISGLQRAFSHELLDDPDPHKRSKSPLPHTLESDKKVAFAAAAAAVAAKPQSPGNQSDEPVTKKKHRGPHDISQDVRIMSPSGRVLALHAVDDDETTKKTAQFPKSPHPNAVSGVWIVHDSGTSGSAQ